MAHPNSYNLIGAIIASKRRPINTRQIKERAVLVGVQIRSRPELWSIEDSLEELGRLAESAGASVVNTIIQSLSSPVNTYLGKGKLNDLQQICLTDTCDTVIFDDELTPTQQRRFENILRKKVIDRTALILDIFASRARSREGVLQVQLAQLEYLMPRLVGQWSHLERLGGGIGTRGPGESQLETDRRLISQKIIYTKKQLEKVKNQRWMYRQSRRQSGLPTIALVGYTNAGKSALMNTLTKKEVVSKNQLFSTLDPLSRKFQLTSDMAAILTDTVGFIHKLPTFLIAAFRATLEQLDDASVILHVADVSHKLAENQISIVTDLMKELSLTNKPTIVVLNKLDLVTKDKLSRANLTKANQHSLNTVLVSAKTGEGIKDLIEMVVRKVKNHK